MLKTKLYQVLKTMNFEELKRFQSFAQSPYHNSNKTISRFVKYICHYFEALNGKTENKRFDKKVIFKKVYTNTEFKEGTFAVLRSQTLSLIEEFFIIESFKEKKKLGQKFLAESYSEKKISRAYKNNYLKYEKENIKEKHTDPFWIMHRLEILMTKMSWNEYDQLGKGYLLLTEVLEELDIFFLHQKMRHEALKANICRVKGIPVNSHFYDNTIGAQIDEYKENNKVLGLHLLLRELLYGGEELDMLTIEVLRKDFEVAFSELDAIDKNMIYFSIQNVVIREYNKKGKRFAPILFDIYMTGVKSNLLVSQGEISYKTFYNIIIVGSIARKFKELEAFIDDYGNKIDLGHRESTLLLTEVRVLHDKRTKDSWKTIIDLMLDFSHPDIIYKMKGRTLQLKAYFMMFQEDNSYRYLVTAKIKAFKAFLAREKNNLKAEGKSTQRFTFWLQKLAVAQANNKSRKHMNNMFHKIKEDEKLLFSHKEWMLELQTEKKGR